MDILQSNTGTLPSNHGHFAIEHGRFPIKRGRFPIKHGRLRIKHERFPPGAFAAFARFGDGVALRLGLSTGAAFFLGFVCAALAIEV